jgi:hypothetical protein
MERKQKWDLETAAEEPGEHFLFLCFTATQLFSRRHET